VSYWSYYLAWTFFAYAARQPILLVGVAIFLLLRRVIPDPGALFRAMGRLGKLRSQVAVNAADVKARRDLAQIYLDLLRPGAALELLEAGIARKPDEAELQYLTGVALQRIGKHEAALSRLEHAIDLSPRIRFGMPFMLAGESLLALGRYEEAISAYEHYVDINSSDIAGPSRMAIAQAKLGDREGARKSVDEAIKTWSMLPGGLKRRSFGRWLAAQWSRVWLIHDPRAIALALIGSATIAFMIVRGYPWVSAAWASAKVAPDAQDSAYDALDVQGDAD
jgi:tetratricopeptide (TPR) repeat protein